MTKPFNPADLQRAESFFRNNMPGSLADGDSVLPGGMKVRDDKTRIEYEERFLERNSRIQQQNVHLTPSVMFANALIIQYPTLEYYGPEHGRNTSQLAVYAAEVDGITDHTDLEVLKAAALMHDVGRTKPWQVVDKDAPRRSAEMADRFIRSDAQGARLGAAMREGVCRLIAQYDPQGTPPRDPLGRCLWDADHMETARFSPNSPEGRKATEAAYRALLTPWAQEESTKKRWLRKYKWDTAAWGL